MVSKIPEIKGYIVLRLVIFVRIPQSPLICPHPFQLQLYNYSIIRQHILLVLGSNHTTKANLSRFIGTRSCERGAMAAATPTPVQKSEEEWKAILNPEQFHILRQKGTELRGTGEYDKFFGEGVYNCAGCGTPLYKSTTKFDSGCGWPAFFEGLPGAITRSPDPDGRRTEITCTACGGHLGHVFKGEGHKTPTDERHCVNSVSIKFIPPNSST